MRHVPRVRTAGQRFVAAGLSLVVLVTALAVASAQTPVFRGGIDLVSIDVVVLDKSGTPVSSLAAGDFTVVAGGKPRRVVSTEFINPRPPERSVAAASAPGASSNARPPAGRTIVFVVDAASILAGGGRVAFKGLGDALARFGPEDRLGLMTLPSGSPRVEPTTDRAEFRAAVARLAGTSIRLSDREMTFGEAAGIYVGDRGALGAFWARIVDQGYALPGDRTCTPPQGYEQIMTVPAICKQEAERALQRARGATRGLLDRVRSLAEAMTALQSPKSIVLISGGLLVDEATQAPASEFAAAAERSRVSLYSLLVEALPGEASSGNSSGTRRLDTQTGLGGLTEIAVSARGSVHRVLGDPAAALERIDRELSGYYLLSFERDPADRDGARVGIDVRTKRDGVSVTARKSFTATSAEPVVPPADLKAAVGELLKSSAPIPGVPVEIDAFALPVAETGGEARTVLAVELGRNPPDVVALGFQVADARGKVVADGFDAPAKLQSKSDGRSVYLATLPLTAGRFIARVGVIDAVGRRGSLQHAFEIAPWPNGPVRVSDLIFGDAATGNFVPGVRGGPSALAVRVVVRDSSSKFAGMRVRLEVTRASDDGAIERQDVPLAPTPDPLRRFADATLNVSRYVPGDYLVSVIVLAGDAEVARRRRAFSR